MLKIFTNLDEDEAMESPQKLKKQKNKIENDDAEYIVSGGSWGKKIIGPSNPGAIPSSSSP